MSTWGFKNNLILDNNTYISLFDPTGVTKSNIIGLDINSNLNINSASGDLFLNSNNSGSSSFLNFNNSKNVIISSKLAVGINSTSNVNANLTLVKNGFIGINTTQGNNDSYLGLAGSSSLSNTTGSRMLLYGNDNTNGNNGNLNIYAGNSSSGSINMFTGNDTNIFQILKTGTSNFSPNGSTIRLSISDTNSIFTHPVEFTTGITTTSILSTGLTTGDINFTGSLYQNSVPYIGSQWSGTSGTTLYYGSGGNTLVGINTTNPTFNLDVNGSARITTGITTGTILSTGLTTGDINFTGVLYQNNVPYSSNSSQWSGTSGTTLYYGSGGNTLVGINTTNPTSTLTINGDLNVSGNTTLGNLVFTNGTIANIVTNNVNYGIANTFSGSFMATNNVPTPANITGFAFNSSSIRSFTAKVTVSIVRSAGGNLYATFTLDGIQTDSGWILYESYDGDNTGIDFSITNLGVMQYTSTNLTNFTSSIFRYSVTQITNTGTYETLLNPTVGSYIVDGFSSINFLSTNFTTTNFNITNFSISNLNTDFLNTGNINYGIANTFSGTFFANVNGSPVSVTQLIFNSSNIVSFTINMTVSTSTLFELFVLEGIQTSTGWSLLSTSQGDVTNVVFSINTSTGQVNYTSTVGATFRFVVTQTSKTGTYNSLAITTIGNYIMNSLSTNTLSVGNVTVGGNLIPDTTIIRDLGSSTNRWRDLYLSGNTIDLGGTLISSTTGGIVFGSTVLTTTTVGNVASSIPNLVATTINASTGITVGSILISSGNLNISSGALNVSGNISSESTISGNVFTGGSLNVSGTTSSLVFTGGSLNVSGTTSSLVFTGGSLNVSGTTSSLVFTGGSLQISGTTSTGTLVATNSVFTNISTGTLRGTDLFLSGTLTTVNITTQNILVSTGYLLASSSTLGSLLVSGTTSSLVFTGGSLQISGTTSTSNLVATTATIPNMFSTNITTTNLVVNNIGRTADFSGNGLNGVMVRIGGNRVFTENSGVTNIPLLSDVIISSSNNLYNSSSVGTNVSIGSALTVGLAPSGTGNLTLLNSYSLYVLGNSRINGSLMLTSGSLNIFSGNINMTGGSINISGGSINISGNISSASTISGNVFTGGSLQISGTTSSLVFTGGSLQISGTTSTSNLVATTSSIPNSVFTNISTGTLNATTLTIPNNGTNLLIVGSTGGVSATSMLVRNTSGNLEICVAGGTGQFSSSAIVGDVILRNNNSTKNMMFQIGGNAAHIYLASSGNVNIPGALFLGSTATQNPVLSNSIRQIARGNSGTGLTNGSVFAVSFPFTFSSVPIIFVSIDTVNLGPTVIARDATTTGFNFICGNPTGITSVNWLAIN